MQQLQFEKAWERTISQQDRDNITKIFNKTKACAKNKVEITLIKHAINHKKEALFICLIHNFTNQDFIVDDVSVEYKENEISIARQHFHHPRLIIQSKVSMPWTFIFPMEQFDSKPTWKKQTLDFITNNGI